MDEDEQALGLLSALRGDGGADIGAASESNVDEIPESLQVKSAQTVDGEEPAKVEETAEAKAAEEDFLEIEGEDGVEPQKIAVKDALDGYKNWKQFEDQQAMIIDRVQKQAQTHAASIVREQEELLTGVQTQLQAVLQVIQPPQRPSDELKNPNSPYYNPEQYNVMRDQYDQAITRYQQVQRYAQGIAEFQRDEATAKAAAAEKAQFAALTKAWPEWGDPVKGEATQRGVANALWQHYSVSFSDAEKITHPGLFLMAKDAMAYKAMQASAPKTKASIEAKAAKLVKGGGQRMATPTRTKDGQFAAADALTRLRKSHGDADAVSFFEGHFKSQSAKRA